MPCVIAIDQSTSATKALLIDEACRVQDRESRVHSQIYPQPGWVEHDAEEIWNNTVKVVRTLVFRKPELAKEVVALSITNQRETVVVFDKRTGKPLLPAIVWQCRRSESLCKIQIANGADPFVYSRTGLKIDPYFSASKIQWILKNHPDIKEKIDRGDALLGTMDCYLLYRFTDGKVFATDPTNASRTMLYDISRRIWDEELCSLWQVPLQALPEVRECNAVFGETTVEGVFEQGISIVGMMGDSQASLFGQRCFQPGDAKVTFGTGSSILFNIGMKPLFPENGVLTALGWVLNKKPVYALEGIIIHSASTLNWLKHQLGLVSEIYEIEALAEELDDNGGVYLVPAFSGLGLPYWDSGARAALVGLSGHSDRRNVALAALESMGYQLRDAIVALEKACGIQVAQLKADGGPTRNRRLMQFCADVTRVDLSVAESPDCSALGVALMGFLGTGVYDSVAAIPQYRRDELKYQTTMPMSKAQALHSGWRSAVNQVLLGNKENNKA